MEFFERFLAFDLETLPYVIITLLIAFSVHEFAHAFVAYKFGDPTAKKEGRLTLNPIVHLDPIGTLLLLFAGFGWARPVPVNRFYFKKPRMAGILVSLAGPFSNFLLAFIGAGLQLLVSVIGIGGNAGVFLFYLFHWFTLINAVLGVFNLLPLPPLDGYRIIEDLVPNESRAKLTVWENYGVILFIILVVIDPLYNRTIGPVLSGGVDLVLRIIFDFYGLFS